MTTLPATDVGVFVNQVTTEAGIEVRLNVFDMATGTVLLSVDLDDGELLVGRLRQELGHGHLLRTPT